MRAVVQRVKRAQVSVEGGVTGSIGVGLCVLLGVTHDDGPAQVAKIARKIAQQRILRNPEGEDEPGLRVSAEESQAPVLLVSQFTLYADVRKGRRPGWSHAAPGPVAEPLVAAVAAELRTTYGLRVEEGQFGAMMEVEIVNDGPFTILLEA
ncbi:D-aminoacyl-tRNA deacylase [Actinomycetaceae bacterium L2_0104]